MRIVTPRLGGLRSVKLGKLDAEMSSNRTNDLIRFYALLRQLKGGVGGTRLLRGSSKKSGWPGRGVYFFHEAGEHRSDTGDGPRVVRVGTHAVSRGSKTTLWKRLAQHRGSTRSGGGNHRGSVFRKHVGLALIQRDQLGYPTWGDGSNAPREIRETERAMEQVVSGVIGDMPFVWLDVDDEPSKDSLRAYIEAQSIALLSNFEKSQIDSPSETWLGFHRNHREITASGLWNVRCVKGEYDPMFLDTFERLINAMVRG